MKKIAIAAALIVTACICFKEYMQIDADIWNGGICTECGGNYEYVETIPHSSYIQYKYECNNCHYGISTETDFR